jgi:lipoprotein NlpI
LEPEKTEAYPARADIYYIQGQYDKAVEDYNRVIEISPEEEYCRLMVLIAARNISNERAQAYLDELRDYVKGSSSTEWMRTISNYYLGIDGLTEQTVLDAARHSANEKEKQIRVCEAYYYLAEERIWKGNKKGAQEFFAKSVETKQYSAPEYRLSKAMLRKMQKTGE